MKTKIRITLTHTDGTTKRYFYTRKGAVKFFSEFMGENYSDLPEGPLNMRFVDNWGGVVYVEFLEGENVADNTVNRYKYVIERMTSTKECRNNQEWVWFHYFNECGLMAQTRLIREELFALVDAGKINTGSLLAYNFDFANKGISRLASLPKFNITRTAISVWAEMTTWEINEARKFIAEHK